MRTTALLLGIVAALLLAAPFAAAEPQDRPADHEKVVKQAEKLKKEIEKLEKKLTHARERSDASPEALEAQQRRLAKARQRLAGLMARARQAHREAARERGGTERRRGDGHEPARRRGDGNSPARRRGDRPSPAQRRGADHARGPQRDRRPDGSLGEMMGALRRMHAEQRRLAQRVETLERQIRRLAAAVGKQARDRRGPERERGARDRRRPGRERGPGARGRHGPGPDGRHGASVEARLARLERAIGKLVRHGRDRGPGRFFGRRHHGQGDGPRWPRMLRARARWAGPRAGADCPFRDF